MPVSMCLRVRTCETHGWYDDHAARACAAHKTEQWASHCMKANSAAGGWRVPEWRHHTVHKGHQCCGRMARAHLSRGAVRGADVDDAVALLYLRPAQLPEALGIAAEDDGWISGVHLHTGSCDSRPALRGVHVVRCKQPERAPLEARDRTGVNLAGRTKADPPTAYCTSLLPSREIPGGSRGATLSGRVAEGTTDESAASCSWAGLSAEWSESV